MEYSAHVALPSPRSAFLAGAPMAQPGSLGAIIARIEEAIDAETNALRNDPDFDLAASNARKSRALYEMTRAIRGDAPPRPEDQVAIMRLKDKLAINERAIRAHISAVGEIAALIQGAIQHAETDGTYSSLEFGRV